MPEATHTSTPSRRSFLGRCAGAGAAALLVEPFAAHAAQADAAGPDAELLRLVAQFQAAQAEIDSWNNCTHPEYGDNDEDFDRVLWPIQVRQGTALVAIAAIPARTQAGIVAKASVVRVAFDNHYADDDESVLALSLAADIEGRARA